MKVMTQLVHYFHPLEQNNLNDLFSFFLIGKGEMTLHPNSIHQK